MRILFLGEEKNRSAEYLRETLIYLKHSVKHIGCNEKTTLKNFNFDIIIISDYPAKKISKTTANSIINFVNNGGSLIMIGGWISFNGKGTSYYSHPLAKVLPVNLSKNDDRTNYHQGLLLYPNDTIRKKYNLKWDLPPVICGYNDIKVKDNSKTLIWMKPIVSNGKVISFTTKKPFLITKPYGKGNTVACVTDVAPHWCGGLVDWGNTRKIFKNVEVGLDYIKFIALIIEEARSDK